MVKKSWFFYKTSILIFLYYFKIANFKLFKNGSIEKYRRIKKRRIVSLSKSTDNTNKLTIYPNKKYNLLTNYITLFISQLKGSINSYTFVQDNEMLKENKLNQKRKKQGNLERDSWETTGKLILLNPFIVFVENNLMVRWLCVKIHIVKDNGFM